MDNNLEICRSYFQAKHYFVNHTIPFNRGENSIDLLAIDPLNQVVYDCMIKRYEKKHMSETKFTTISRNLNDIKRSLRVKSYIGDLLISNFEYRKVVITSSFIKNDYWANKFEEHNIEVMFLTDLIAELREMPFKNCQLLTDHIINVIKLG